MKLLSLVERNQELARQIPEIDFILPPHTPEHPLNISSFGGGVQSFALGMLSLHGHIDPPADAFIFSDTGWEREKTYEAVKFFTEYAAGFQVPVYTVTGGNIYEDSLNPNVRAPSLPYFIKATKMLTAEEQKETILAEAGEDSLFTQIDGYVDELEEHLDEQIESGEITDTTETRTGMLRRQCTADYKIRPIQKKIKELVPDVNFKNPIIQWIGFSIDEVQRMKPSRVKYLKLRYPLIELRFSRQTCIDWLLEQGFPVPSRSSCIGCPYHSAEEWTDLTDDEFQSVIDFENGVRKIGLTHPNRDLPYADNRVFLHRSLTPIEERPFENTDNDLHLKENACGGGCFL